MKGLLKPPPKKGPFCEAPLDSQDFKLQEWWCVFFFSGMDEYNSMGFLSQILPRIKATKQIYRLIPENPS